MDIIKIDGSYGEGGGSILRYALSMSVITMKPIEMFNIRVKRKKPGLRPQHLNAVRALARLSNAKVEGDYVGSKRLLFIPQSREGGSFEIDIGTAGSISLIIQAILPAAIFSDKETRIKIRGGTDVPMSPPIDYMREVFLPNIAMMGVKAEIELIRRGHYPKGGGLVELRVWPSKLEPIVYTERGEIKEVKGRAHAVKLPLHVVKRIVNSAKDVLMKKGLSVHIEEEWSKDSHLGPGAGITLWTTSSPTIGSDDLGERGKPSERVGENAAVKLLSELDTGMAFDNHSGDMIIPYLALADGKSKVGISKLTLHAKSNIWLVEKFLPVKYKVEGNLNGPVVVEVTGTGV